MALYDIGRVCLKIAGRDAGKRCVIVELLDDGRLLVDGETRRRKCSPKHVEPLKQTLDLKKGASHEEVTKAFAGLGLELRDTKAKKAAERPRKVRAKKEKPVKEKAAPETAKPEAPKEKQAPPKKEQPASKPATEKASPAEEETKNGKKAENVGKAPKSGDPRAESPKKEAPKKS